MPNLNLNQEVDFPVEQHGSEEGFYLDDPTEGCL
jgi:hypothetical protein